MNYCVWTRGNAGTYDTWARLVGDPYWSYDNLLPFFKRTENFHVEDVDPSLHGYDGPIHVSNAGYLDKHLLGNPLKEALLSVGLQYNHDINLGLRFNYIK